MGVAGDDVEFAAVGLQDQIAGSAADSDVGKQRFLAKIDDGNIIRGAGGDEGFRIVGQNCNLFGLAGDGNRAERGERVGVEE